ncbi:MAG: EVE domain-containing protein [Cyclobacteriaceae bacterium]|nr:EVE domain-containing protein [Cyclobacteriaceae bacterium]
MNYWLMKTEPGTYSWDDLAKDKKTIWDGIRNFQARNNMKAMKKGDLAFIYHSNEGKNIVGVAKITKEHFPDPSATDWVVVEISPLEKLKKSITLADIKACKKLANMVLVKNSRLSVQPVKETEFDFILKMSQEQ